MSVLVDFQDEDYSITVKHSPYLRKEKVHRFSLEMYKV